MRGRARRTVARATATRPGQASNWHTRAQDQIAPHTSPHAQLPAVQTLPKVRRPLPSSYAERTVPSWQRWATTEASEDTDASGHVNEARTSINGWAVSRPVR